MNVLCIAYCVLRKPQKLQLFPVSTIRQSKLCDTAKEERKNLRKRAFAGFCVLLVVLLAGCASSNLVSGSSFSGWGYSDLRYLQAPDPDTEYSLIAVYQRQTRYDLEIRLDFLDLTAPVDFDLYLALDTSPGGSSEMPFLGIQSRLAYDVLVKIPANGSPTAYDAQLNPLQNIIPRVSDHPGLDAMVIQFNRSQLPGNPNQLGIQVFQTPDGKNQILSQTPPILPNQPQPALAPLLMVFWDTLPSTTPAQTLRRWDGAHTGPFGGRHGLSVLIQAAASQRVPLVLADLKQTASLNGVKAVGGSQRIQQLALSNLAILPDTAVSERLSVAQSLALNRKAAQQAGLPKSAIGYGTFSPPLSAACATFLAALPERNRILNWQGKRLVPLPEAVYPSSQGETGELQITQQGLSVSIRKALLAAALSADPGDLVVLGGSLPTSPWGDFSSAPAAFEWIAAHPWIATLDEAGLNNLPAQTVQDWPLPQGCPDLLCSPDAPAVTVYTGGGSPVPSGLNLPQLQAKLRQELTELPPGPFAERAWQTYLTLTAPTSDRNLAGLQANALGQVGYLLEAARWEARSSGYTQTVNPISDCTIDPDFDGVTECRLVSDSALAIFKPEGARLVFYATRAAQGVTQWIAPASQLGVGLGDPSQWHPELGPAGDPAEIAGAFAPLEGPYEAYAVETQPGRIAFHSNGSDLSKTFSLSADGLKVEIRSPEEQVLRIPLLLADQEAPAPPVLSDRQWIWQPDVGTGLRITFAGDLTLSGESFLDSASALLAQEDPNRVYPRGHYLPDPLAVVEVRGKQVDILFSVGSQISGPIQIEDQTFRTPISESTLMAYQAGTPIANELQAVIAARALLSMSRMKSIQSPEVVDVQRITLAEAKKKTAQPGAGDFQGISPETPVWFVVFKGTWQLHPPSPGITVTLPPPYQGCQYVWIAEANNGYAATGNIDCTTE
jgi:hypothetical protein